MRFMTETLRRRLALAALVSAVATSAACDDDDLFEVDDEPAVASIVIVSGSSSATVSNASGTQTGALTLRQNLANPVIFRFVNADGQDDPVIVANRGQYEIRPGTPLPASVTFAASGGTGASFNATITPTAAGQVIIPFLLFNTQHGHGELTRNVTATVQP